MAKKKKSILTYYKNCVAPNFLIWEITRQNMSLFLQSVFLCVFKYCHMTDSFFAHGNQINIYKKYLLKSFHLWEMNKVKLLARCHRNKNLRKKIFKCKKLWLLNTTQFQMFSLLIFCEVNIYMFLFYFYFF